MSFDLTSRCPSPFISGPCVCVCFWQCVAPRGVPQCCTSERHCKWSHQPVHHDPVAASTREPSERHPQRIHRPVRSLIEIYFLFFMLIKCSMISMKSDVRSPTARNEAVFISSSYFFCLFIIFIDFLIHGRGDFPLEI